MINVIANTCLMFCDRKSMSDHIDYDMETNNASSMVPFRQKSTFCELANEVSNWFDGDFDLETLLCDYKMASDCFASYFKTTKAPSPASKVTTNLFDTIEPTTPL